MRPRSFKVGPLVAAVANNIATSQTPTSSVTLNGALVSGGVAILDTYRRVRITTGGDESGKTATIVGQTFGNLQTTDVLALPASATTVDSAIDFNKVYSITLSAAAANALTVGTSPIAGSPWFNCDTYGIPNVSVQVAVSGTVNYTVQQTLDDPNNTTSGAPIILPYQVNWVNSSDTNVVTATATKQTNYLFVPAYSRCVLNSSTNPGFIVVSYIQAGDN